MHRILPLCLLVCLPLLGNEPLPSLAPTYVLGCEHPEQGPRGQKGPRGVPGPPGVAFVPSFLSVFTLDGCQSPNCNGILPQTAVIFEELAIPVQGPAMSYDNTTGTVTFNSTGFFEVTYGMVIDPLPNASLALQINPAGIYSATPGFVTGSGLVPGSEIYISTQDRLARVSVIIQVTQVNQTLQVVSGNTAGKNISMDTQSGGTLIDPILAFVTIKQLK